MRRCTFVLLGCLLVSSAKAELSIRLQSQLGGESRAIAASEDGTLAYLGVGPCVVALDLSAPSRICELGKSDVLPEVIEDIAIQGDYAFVANGKAGLYILNVSDVANPTVVGQYAVSSQHTSSRGTHVSVVGKYAYFSDGPTGLHILDVSNPAKPVCLANLNTIQTYDVAISGGYAYLAALDPGRLMVLDISDPTQPRVVSQLAVPLFPREVEFSGGYAYLTGTRMVTSDQLGLYAIDVRDPVKPVLASRCDMDNTGELVVTEKIAYVARGWSGLAVVRITNPSLPAYIGSYSMSGSAMAAAVAGNRLYLMESYVGLEVFDITRPMQPILEGTYATTSIQDVAVSGVYAYVTSYESGFQVIDASDPKSPQWLAWLDFDWATHCVAVAKGCVCVGCGAKLMTLDVSNPAAPEVMGSCEAGGEPYDMEVVGANAYVAVGKGMSIVDLSDPRVPAVLGRCELSNTTWGISVSGSYAYVTSIDGLDIVDISKPTAPRRLGRYKEWYWPWKAVIYGDYAYVANMSMGMVVVDVSDPELPGRVRCIGTSYAQDIALQGHHAYLTDMTDGLRIFDISSPILLPCLAEYTGAGHGEVAVAGGYIYTADTTKGLSILKVEESDDSEF